MTDKEKKEFEEELNQLDADEIDQHFNIDWKV